MCRLFMLRFFDQDNDEIKERHEEKSCRDKQCEFFHSMSSFQRDHGLFIRFNINWKGADTQQTPFH
jgi:hypothetical protein